VEDFSFHLTFLAAQMQLLPVLALEKTKANFILEEGRKASTATGQMTQLVSWHSNTLCYTIQTLLPQN